MNTIGERIRYRRKELEMTQDALVAKLGFGTRSTISLMENATSLSSEKVVALAKALDCPVTWLLGVEPETVYVHELDPLVKAYQHADKETQLVVRRILGIKKEELSASEAQAI